MTFKDATADSEGNIIEAGKPYIVRWDAKDNLNDVIHPVFNGVMISKTEPEAVTFDNAKGSDCQFVGQFSPFAITESNKNEIVMLGSGSQLGYSLNTRDLKCFRAHFKVPANGATVRRFVMNTGEGTQTGICHTEITEITENADAWYSLDGRKLDGQPTKKGVYIQNGKKIVMK